MTIKVVNYAPSVSPTVQAFVDVELDGWLRFNGVNFNRDGRLRPAQLTPWRNGKRLFRDAIEVMDMDLRELLATEILAAIRAYVASLPPEQRMRPPRPPTMQPPGKSANGKNALPPAVRLQANFPLESLSLEGKVGVCAVQRRSRKVIGNDRK